MTEIRNINDVRGSVFDLPHAMSLSSEDCNVLLVSSRTLFFIQKFSLMEVGFNARYSAEFLDGDRYVLAQTETDQDDISEIKNNYGLEVMDVTCDIVSAIEGITFAIQSTVTGCGCPVGQGADNESGEEGGVPPGPIGDIAYEYPDPGVTDRKCKASNSVYWSIYNVFVQLEINNVDEMGILGLAVAVGLIGAIIGTAALGPIGGLLVAVAGIIAVFAGRLLGLSIDLENIVAAMVANEDDLICALYFATNAEGARDAYEQVLIDDGTLTSQEIALIMLFLPNAVTNILFFSVEGSESFFDGYVSPNDCASCVPPAENWVIAPSGTFGWTSASPFLGTGTVLNDGTEFTINTVPALAPNPNGHVICLVVDAQGQETVCKAEAGTLRIVSSPGGYASNSGYQCVDFTWCDDPAFLTGMPTVGSSVGMVLMIRIWTNGPQAITFAVDAQPNLC